jgi:hypothetical protein
MGLYCHFRQGVLAAPSSAFHRDCFGEQKQDHTEVSDQAAGANRLRSEGRRSAPETLQKAA